MRTPLLHLLLGAVVLAAAVGCTTTSEGSPTPEASGESRTSSSVPSPTDGGPGDRELPYAGAPAVDNPLDTTRYQEDPCQSLTEVQAQELNLNFPGDPQKGGLGNACRFDGRTDIRARVVISSADEYPYGLSSSYQANEDGKFDFFYELPPIEGYPAVSWAATDDRPNGGCRVEIGTSNEIAFSISVMLAQQFVGVKDPCESAALVAGEVLRTMKAGS